MFLSFPAAEKQVSCLRRFARSWLSSRTPGGHLQTVFSVHCMQLLARLFERGGLWLRHDELGIFDMLDDVIKSLEEDAYFSKTMAGNRHSKLAIKIVNVDECVQQNSREPASTM